MTSPKATFANKISLLSPKGIGYAKKSTEERSITNRVSAYSSSR